MTLNLSKPKGPALLKRLVEHANIFVENFARAPLNAGAITQLRREAGDRQVPDAKLGVVAGYGQVSYGRGLSASACVLGRE